MNHDLGFYLRQDERGDWLYCEDGEERYATLPERVLWDALHAPQAQAAGQELPPLPNPSCTYPDEFIHFLNDRRGFSVSEVFHEICAQYRAALAQRQPLTREQVKELLTEAGYDTANVQARADFITGIRHGEAAHGIGATTGEQPAQRQPLTPDDRERLRQLVMAEMDRRMSRLKTNFHDWSGWPGTWAFADVAVSALQDHLSAHGIGATTGEQQR